MNRLQPSGPAKKMEDINEGMIICRVFFLRVRVLEKGSGGGGGGVQPPQLFERSKRLITHLGK